MEGLPQLDELLKRLANGGVQFILVGGLAGQAHGSARVTYDLDVVYDRSSDNISRLVDVLSPVHPYLRGAPEGLPFCWDVTTVQSGLNSTLVTDLGDLNCLGEVLGGGRYEDLLPHRIDIEAFGVRIRCVDLERLIQLKRACGRPKDLEVIAELQALAEQRRGQTPPPP